MDSLLNRYRNITVLLLVIVGQLILLAVQVKDDRDVPFIRVWTITAVTPFARMVEAVRGGSSGFFHDYIRLHDADAENRRLREENGKLKMDNIFLRNELSEADRVKALQMFQAETQSKTIAARVFGVGAAASAKMVYLDRGSVSGVERGMAVVTPDGIVGKIIAVYPTASQALLVTDPDFAAGVISQKNQARGDIKGTGKDYCIVDYVPSSEKVEVGEWFYTSGDDRIFPRGFPAGVVKQVRDAQPFKEIIVEPSGPHSGLEDVLIILNGVHEAIPKTPPSAQQQVYIAPPPPGSSGATGDTGSTGATGTAADKLKARYKAIGDAQNHVFGEGLPGSKPPNFNLPMSAIGASGATGAAAPAERKPPASGTEGGHGATGPNDAQKGQNPPAEPHATGPGGASGATGAAAPAERKLPAEPHGGATGPSGASGATGATAPTGRKLPAEPHGGATGPSGASGALPPSTVDKPAVDKPAKGPGGPQR